MLSSKRVSSARSNQENLVNQRRYGQMAMYPEWKWEIQKKFPVRLVGFLVRIAQRV